MQNVWRDLAFGARTLRKNPVFALTAIITLALGIGASTAIFSVVNAVLLRPLPYADADRLAFVTQDLRARGVVDFPIGPGDVPDMRANLSSFQEIAALQTGRNVPFTAEDGKVQLVTTAGVTTNLFKLLGLPVAAGRDFADGDGTPNAPIQFGANGQPDPLAQQAPRLPTMAIISYDFWQRAFGGDPSIIGKTIQVFGGVQVIGVASPRAELIFPVSMQVERHPDVWTALRVNFDQASRINVAYRLIGRLKPTGSFTAARAEAARLTTDLQARFPTNKTANVAYRIEPMKPYVVAAVRTSILSLMGAVVLVLLIACANVANLLLVRASQRERELAVRSAMGGSPFTIVRQLLAESFVLATVAAILGIGLAKLGIVLLLRLSPSNLPRLADVSLDPTVLGFTVLLSLTAVLVFGLVPAIRASRPDLAQVLRATGRTPALSGAARLRNAVIVAEVALSFVLLIGSGLMVRSFVSLVRTDPGFDPNGVLTFGVTNLRFRSADEARGTLAQLRDKFAAIPGVTAVTTSNTVPFDGNDPSGRWGTQDAMNDLTRFRQGGFVQAPPSYFDVMRVRLLAGRLFTQAENDDPQSKVVVIDDETAKLAFGTASPLGKTIYARIRTDVPEAYTVIGVVNHHRHLSLFGEEKELLFFPSGPFGGGRYLVRTAGDPTAIAPAVRAAATSVSAQALVTELHPLTDNVAQARSATRFALVLIGIFATIAALLAAIGLYGVLSSVVRQRTSEIGIRMAFGAESAGIFKLVIGQGLRMSAIGIGIGLVIALASTRVMSSMLVGVRPTDPITFAAIVTLFLAIAAAACWVPARRAAGMDPNAALRQE
jgi:putative ABC transport system permease protein